MLSYYRLLFKIGNVSRKNILVIEISIYKRHMSFGDILACLSGRKDGKLHRPKKRPYKPNNKLKYPWRLKLKNSITVSEKWTKVDCLFKNRNFARFKEKQTNLLLYLVFGGSIQSSSTEDSEISKPIKTQIWSH